MNIYVGNLAREVNQEDLQLAFAAFGAVTSAAVIKDKFTGESRGFGFVEMSDNTQGKAAIDGMNGKEIKGKAISANEARPKPSDGRGGGGGFRSGRSSGGAGSFGGGAGHSRGSWKGSRGGHGRSGSGGGKSW